MISFIPICKGYHTDQKDDKEKFLVGFEMEGSKYPTLRNSSEIIAVLNKSDPKRFYTSLIGYQYYDTNNVVFSVDLINNTTRVVNELGEDNV